MNVEILCECGKLLGVLELNAPSSFGGRVVALVVEHTGTCNWKEDKSGKGRAVDSKAWSLVGGGDSPKIPKTTPA